MIDQVLIPEKSEPLERRLGTATEGVRDAIEQIIRLTPVKIRKPAEFHRVFKLDRSLTSRLLRSLDIADPLASLQRMPTPQGLRLFLGAVRKKVGNNKSAFDKAEKAIAELEDLVQKEVGDWKDLNAALCGWVPDVREQFEKTNRQSAFRAMSNLKGVTADAMVSVTLIHPSATDPNWLDRAGITGFCRLRRLRPGTPMGFLHGSSIAPPKTTKRLSLEGNPIDIKHGAPLLKEFSTTPEPKFDVRIDGDIVHYLLKGNNVGLGSSVDLYFADIMRQRYPLSPGISSSAVAPGAVVDVPTETLIVDVLVHQDVWPGIEPELHIYDTAVRGIANPLDLSRELDRIDVLESIQNLGTHTARFRTVEVACYSEMVRAVCSKLGWDSESFCGFRCRIEFPIYGSQLNMIFKPEKHHKGE